MNPHQRLFNAVAFIIAFAIVCVVFATCFTCKGGKAGDTKNTLHIDTQYILIADSMPWRQPELAKTVIKEVPQKVDTAAILKKHFAENHYTKVDTLGRYGKITTEFVVSENEILRTRVVPELIIPTYTVTVQAPKKNEVWIGANSLYTPGNLAVGPSLEFEHKKGWGVNAGAFIDLNGKMIYGVGFKRKLSLKK